MFKVPIKDTDIVSVSLLPTFNNVRPRHLFKIQKYSIYTKIKNNCKNKSKSIENEEIIMAMAMTKTIIAKIIMMRIV